MSPRSPRDTASWVLCFCDQTVRLTNELPAPSAATGRLLREQNDVNGPVVVCAAVPPFSLDKPSSGVGEVMGPEPSVKAPATSTSFQYRVHVLFLYVPNEGLLGA